MNIRYLHLLSSNELFIDGIVNVFPNPTKDKLKLHIKGLSETDVTVRLFNSVTVQILEKEWSVGAESINAEIDMKNLAAGIYFLNISYGDHL